MNLKKIRNILCIAVLLIAAAGTFVLFAYPRFVEPVVKYNEAQSPVSYTHLTLPTT